MFKRTVKKTLKLDNARELSQTVKDFGLFGHIITERNLNDATILSYDILLKTNWVKNEIEYITTYNSIKLEGLY
jgi:hypothetical protein